MPHHRFTYNAVDIDYGYGVWVDYHFFKFPPLFSKEDNFRVSMKDEALPKGVYSDSKEFALKGATSLIQE